MMQEPDQMDAPSPRLALARWFVADFLGREFHPFVHGRQVDLAGAILGMGYTEAEAKGTCLALRAGKIRPGVGTIFSLAFLLSETNAGTGAVANVLDEYRRFKKYQQYRWRPEVREFTAARLLSPPAGACGRPYAGEG